MFRILQTPNPRRWLPTVSLVLAAALLLTTAETAHAQRRQNGASRQRQNQQGGQQNQRNLRGRFGRGRWGNWRPPTFRPPGFRPPVQQPPQPQPQPRPPQDQTPLTITITQQGAYLADFTLTYEEQVNGQWVTRKRNWYNIPVNERFGTRVPAGARNIHVIGEAYVFIGTKGTIFNKTYNPRRTGGQIFLTTTGTTLARDFREEILPETLLLGARRS